MPAKKGSIDGNNFKQKALDTARYVGNNFWKVLPIGSGINYEIKREKAIIDEAEKENPIQHELFTIKDILKRTFHTFYAVSGTLILGLYIYGVISEGAWTPKQIKAYKERVRIEQEIEAEHRSEVNYFYNRIFENAKSFEDSVKIYQKYGLPIKLLKPSLEQKEKVIKQSELEISVK